MAAEVLTPITQTLNAGTPMRRPGMRRKLDGYFHVEPRGCLGAQLDILSRIPGRSPRTDRPETG